MNVIVCNRWIYFKLTLDYDYYSDRAILPMLTLHVRKLVKFLSSVYLGFACNCCSENIPFPPW